MTAAVQTVTADIALQRYREFLAEDRLIQGAHQSIP